MFWQEFGLPCDRNKTARLFARASEARSARSSLAVICVIARIDLHNHHEPECPRSKRTELVKRQGLLVR